MRLGRIRLPNHEIHLARREPDHYVLLHRESDHPAADALREARRLHIDMAGDGPEIAHAGAAVLSPMARPGKFLGVGLNFADHAAEAGMDLPDAPVLFAKTANSIIGPNDPILVREQPEGSVDLEVELVVVVGSRVREADSRESARAIFGYCVGNDVTSREVQFGDGQWVRSKSFDSFGPLGPWIVTAEDIDITALRMASNINGVPLQNGSTSDMIFPPAELVEFASRTMTLEPGDLITTGTPAGVGMSYDPPRYLMPGDVAEVEIEQLGKLKNPVLVDTAAQRQATSPEARPAQT